jgi:hypothetical protein
VDFGLLPAPGFAARQHMQITGAISSKPVVEPDGLSTSTIL